MGLLYLLQNPGVVEWKEFMYEERDINTILSFKQILVNLI
jgi:hypothetical protein